MTGWILFASLFGFMAGSLTVMAIGLWYNQKEHKKRVSEIKSRIGNHPEH